jgi:phosphoribosylglycinamide formyltransferase-1
LNKRVAILISGGGSNMVSLVNSMVGDHPARPVMVIANRPDAGGLQKASALGVPSVVVDQRPHGDDRVAFELLLNAALEQYEPDIICLAGFMRILTPGFVEKWTGRMINIHPSLLPKYPGLHTHRRALEAGDIVAGCTVHEVTPVLDSGPILGQESVPVLTADTAESLAARVLVAEHRLYPSMLRQFALRNNSL